MTRDKHQSAQTKRKKSPRVVVIILVVACIAGIIGRLWYDCTFPYGWSHHCSAQIGATLRHYAANHQGWLPHGQATPEASLSLLCEDTNMVELLCGKNVTRLIADAAMAQNGVLGPGSCGWHYVEGLRDDDDPGIAVLWDKVWGLDHNGRRRVGMAHEVVDLFGMHSLITEAMWPAFVADQKERLTKVIASRQSNAPPVRWSDVESLGPNHAVH